ncbi:aminotransferase-like domain-containing protein [Salinimicrobium flavum]|uniref:PLP-dependent aminotransferase family protein n=1 Tax=Salinimicrobium flavum TaxID=1737065 RepID=A0ABW5ITQ0_9FLAO
MYAFSNAVNSMHSEDVKQLMKQASGKNLISFAGGMPNNHLFPVEQIDEIYNSLPETVKKLCFQYGPTSGYPPLVKSLEDYLENKGVVVGDNKILVTTGSLQAISIITQEFVNEGDIILTENPCFVGALTVFETFGAEIHSIPIDKHGIDIEALKSKIESLERKPKFLYVTPNYHNPAGIIYSPERKKELLEALSGTGIILLEDDAYSDLYFNEDEKHLTKAMKSFGVKDVEIIYTGSFSKILGPGFRLGFMLSSEEIFEKAETVKQALDACTSNFMQILGNEFLVQNKLEPYLKFLRSEYQERRDLLQKHLKTHMPKEITWNEPKGGFYVWLKLPPNISSTDIFNESVTKGVVFVTGRTFDPASKKDDRLRLSFSNMPKDQIEKGVIILSEAIKEVLQNSKVVLS